MYNQLYTTAGETLQGQPWQAYPRPMLKRDDWLNLNGEWKFTAYTKYPNCVPLYTGTIRVPFPPESLLSGVNRHFPEGSWLTYSRTFTFPEGFRKDLVFLHVGAADQNTYVSVNGVIINGNFPSRLSHKGGYDHFSFNITRYLNESENQISISCRDNLRDREEPHGKQSLKRGGMWYTPVSGIWQTVWLESVSEAYIQKLDIQTGENYARIDTGNPAFSGTVTVITPEGPVELPLYHGRAEFVTDTPRMWSPEDPWLYRITVKTPEDTVESYFALRTLEVKTVDGCPRLCLNGKPYFFHGLLDQGYWSDGLYTPATPECYEEDILAMKRLGFNTLRKHIKVEPDQFYYDCDRLGMIVFQDMVNNGDYSFLRDTVLPTIGLQKVPDRYMHNNDWLRSRFLECMTATVEQLRHHPCICYWTIFNEGWGQFDANSVYKTLHRLDSSRFIDATSGWFRQKETDVDSRHVYFRPLKLEAREKPLVLSEFGGYSCKIPTHSFNPKKTYGYGKFESAEAFADALEALYLEQVVPLIKQGLCAAIYTQVSDVEDETNGLLTYDRKVIKVDEDRMRKIAAALKI